MLPPAPHFMPTVLETIKRSYKKIQVLGRGDTLGDDEIADAISEMNAMMWEHDADGLNVGWSDVTSSEEALPVPDYMTAFIENGLAIRMAPEFGVQFDPRLAAMYEQALKVVEKNRIKLPRVRYPSIMPKGGGSANRYVDDLYFRDPTACASSGQTEGFELDDDGTYDNDDCSQDPALNNNV